MDEVMTDARVEVTLKLDLDGLPEGMARALTFDTGARERIAHTVADALEGRALAITWAGARREIAIDRAEADAARLVVVV